MPHLTDPTESNSCSSCAQCMVSLTPTNAPALARPPASADIGPQLRVTSQHCVAVRHQPSQPCAARHHRHQHHHHHGLLLLLLQDANEALLDEMMAETEGPTGAGAGAAAAAADSPCRVADAASPSAAAEAGGGGSHEAHIAKCSVRGEHGGSTVLLGLVLFAAA